MMLPESAAIGAGSIEAFAIPAAESASTALKTNFFNMFIPPELEPPGSMNKNANEQQLNG
jgi:hypothetical protein